MGILESPKCIVTLCRGQTPWERGDRPADVNGALVALNWLDLGMIGAWAVDAPFYARTHCIQSVHSLDMVWHWIIIYHVSADGHPIYIS
jgi:hypothetical protein